MRTDSQSAMSIIKNLVHHDRTKHVEVDRQFISKKAASAVIEVAYVPSIEQTTDILTKATSREVLQYLRSKLDLYNAYTKFEGEC